MDNTNISAKARQEDLLKRSTNTSFTTIGIHPNMAYAGCEADPQDRFIKLTYKDDDGNTVRQTI
jgi:predicted short-subunit dehydrogenase-like oxidoreductase (DUF2520 family)